MVAASLLLVLVGVAVAVFVAYNIGGSNIGVAFGPAVGCRAVSKLGATVLMTIFFFLGGWTVGRNVVATMGGEIVPSSLFTIEASIGVLFFIGFALFLSNVVGVPASTSMTGVGSIAGLGLATGTLNEAVMFEIVSWWILAPLIAFWVSGVIGRYLYPYLIEYFAITQTEGSLLELDRSGSIPMPALGPGTTQRELFGTALVIIVSCYAAFSAGASNVANAIAPLIGNGSITMNQGILLAGVASGVGAYTIGRRTLDTVGDDLTEMPLLAALVVATVSSTLVTVLSELGIPSSIVVIATMSIVGLGWGRATRTVSLSETISGESPEVSVGALAADSGNVPTVGGTIETPTPEAHPTPIGDEESEDLPTASDLFRPGESARVIVVQNFVPAVATIAAFLLFRFFPPG